jgi:hypothetical protein
MLKLIHETKRKRAAQSILEQRLKAALKRQGNWNVGFPGGNFDRDIYSAGEGKLWVAFSRPDRNAAVARYWNGFGVFGAKQPAQAITVEINIATNSNSGQVAGFFAEDPETGDIFLMHSGKVGGGHHGVGKLAFLVRSKSKLVEVVDDDGRTRTGIAVSKLSDPDLAGRIWAFVRSVHSFKDEVSSGILERPEFKNHVKEFEIYSKEFSGKKQGLRGGAFEYVTYHGDIVQALYDERMARLQPGENVFNSGLIDLFVKRDGVMSEIYEVKTGIGRQTLYTAIGQLVTHAATDDKVSKILVIPADDEMSDDLRDAIAALGIRVRHFRLGGSVRKTAVVLD